MTHKAAAVEVDDADNGGRFNELKLTTKNYFRQFCRSGVSSFLLRSDSGLRADYAFAEMACV